MQRPSLLDAPAGAVSFKTPALWRYHPARESTLGARLDLKDGAILLAGDRGERWLAEKRTGRISAAARLAPERIVFVMQREDRFIFVGQEGTSYEAETPLGPFVRSSAPLDRLARVSAAAGAIVGVTRGNELVHSEDAGATWRQVGPERTRFIDVEITTGGSGLALAVPEAWYGTSNAGASWKAIDLPKIGGVAVSRRGKDELFVESAMGAKRYTPAQGFSSVSALPGRQRYQLTKRPPRGPSAAALKVGRAILVGGSYLEVASAGREKGRSSWLAWRGAFDGALKSEPLAAADGCRSVRIAGFGEYLALLCSRRNVGSAQELELFLSEDAGKSWERDGDALVGKLAELSLVVAREGQVVITGICAPAASRGCSPYGVYHRRRVPPDAGASARVKRAVRIVREDAGVENEQKYEFAPAATPSLDKVAQELAVSADGRRIYAVGKRTKGTGFAIYVSEDGGQTFEGQEIPELVAAGTSGGDDDEGSRRFARPPRNSRGAQVERLSAGDDGTLSVVFRNGQQRLLAIADEEGRLIQLSRAPADARLVGASGTRALAVEAASRRVFESLDGGSSWEPVGRLPIDLCPGDSDCDVPLVCTPFGCTVGAELSRIGWHGQGDDDLGVLAPARGKQRTLFDRRVRKPISCTLNEAGWISVSGLDQPPNANQASIGKLSWFSLVRDAKSASARIVSVKRGAKGRLDTTALLAPVTNPSAYAFYASTQVEGAAAIRYRAPESSGNTAITGVEVAWENFLEGRSGRGKIPNAGPYAPGDYSRASVGGQSANVDLLSVAQGGVYVRAHSRNRADQSTFFLDGRGVTALPPIQWGKSSLSTRVTEVVRVDGQHVFMRLLENGAVVQAAKAPGGDVFAFTTGLPKPRDFGMTQSRDLAYADGKPGLHLMTFDSDGDGHTAFLFPFSPSGAAVAKPIRVPMLVDTADPPRRCNAVARKDSTRLVVPFQAGTRHPIVVTDTVEPMRVLLSARAVMHGSVKEACVAAFDAEGLTLDPADSAPRFDRALVVLDDSEPSWLFRRNTATSPNSYEARTMTCRFDPNAEVPLEVYSAPGTLVGRGR